MFYEFAIDPTILKSWDNCRYIKDHFGVPKGRMISRFPKAWFKIVHQGISDEVPPRERTKIINALNKIKEQRSFSAFRNWDNDKDWNKNVIEQHELNPFYGIISNAINDEVNEVIFFDELDEDHPHFKIDTSVKIKRTEDDMANTVRPFLIFGKEFKFIDPYFNGVNNRHVKPLIKFLETIVSRENKVPIDRVEYHFNDKIKDKKFLEQNILTLENKIPNGIKIDFYSWPTSKMHDRFILTNLGGVSFGIGLDIHEGSGNEVDTITLLDDQRYEKEWDDYSSSSEHLVCSIDKT